MVRAIDGSESRRGQFDEIAPHGQCRIETGRTAESFLTISIRLRPTKTLICDNSRNHPDVTLQMAP
jgi:hypothetical protein